jgi:hypothetical protein
MWDPKILCRYSGIVEGEDLTVRSVRAVWGKSINIPILDSDEKTYKSLGSNLSSWPNPCRHLVVRLGSC